MIAVAAGWKVTLENLEQKTSEMINNSIYFTGASQRPSKQVKFDFFYMHCVNSSIFFSAFLKQDWLSAEDKCRLIEWKGRFDLALYVSRGCPELKLEEITEYKPKNPNDSWPDIIKRVNEFPDDGHASKLIRAIAHGEQVSKQYEGEDGFVIKGDMFSRLGHMAIDSVEAGDPHWVRNAGFDQAWEKIPDRAKL
jgi:Questin oxidase-like